MCPYKTKTLKNETKMQRTKSKWCVTQKYSQVEINNKVSKQTKLQMLNSLYFPLLRATIRQSAYGFLLTA